MKCRNVFCEQGSPEWRSRRAALAAQQRFMEKLLQLVKLISREGANRKKKVFTVFVVTVVVCICSSKSNKTAQHMPDIPGIVANA